MHIHEKALYNLLRLNWLRDPTLVVQPWQVDDYRALEQTEIFNRLRKIGIVLDDERFLAYAQELASPEELTALLWTKREDDVKGQDRAYLLLFELWRRLMPQKETLTLFCDELDHQISCFVEEGKVEDVDEILVRLEDILDSYVDSGENPKKVFQTISLGCAYDLEGFLYEYITDLIEASEEMLASELLDGFFEYVSDTNRFEFLRIRLFANVDPHETSLLLNQLVESLKRGVDFDLLLEIARFLVSFGQDPLYRRIILKALDWMKAEEEFVEILHTLQDYFCCLDQEEKQAEVKALIKKREGQDPQSAISAKDQDVEEIKQFLISEK